MTERNLTRREAFRQGSAALAGLAAWLARPEFVFPGQKDEEKLVPFLNQPETPGHQLDWQQLDEWITPQEQAFNVQHYGIPEVDADEFRLKIAGLLQQPKQLSMQDIRQRPRQEQLMTLECSGNGASKKFMAAIHNSKWTGTPLAPLLKECQPTGEAREVVFYGADEGETEIHNNSGDYTFTAPFARSMPLEAALDENVLLAYQRNGKPLARRHGAPLRLIVPGWYGVANVKWLTRIEVRPSRYMGRFMARDYVTLRGERQDGEIVWKETLVDQMNLKSLIARVTRRPTQDGKIPVKAYGAVWGDGTPIKHVEVKLNNGDWQTAQLAEKPQAKYSWRFFSIDLGALEPGRHTLVSRATDINGRVQPSADDDEIALKKTYWEAYQQWPREIELQA